MADVEPGPGNDYQVSPSLSFNRARWNTVMASIAARLKARELLEATFETLIANGTQAALDLVSQNVAPQLEDLIEQINALEEQLEDIIGGGTAPNALQLGGQNPSYYLALANATGALPASKVTGIDAMITASIDAVRDSAPAVLDTFREIAESLGNNPSLATDVMAALANRVRFDAAQGLTAPQKAQALANIGAMRNGECRLGTDTNARVWLVPYNGNRLIIDGVERVIPSTGVKLSVPAADTLYRVYAYWTGTAIALEASPTAYQRDPNNGLMVKIGDASRTLVGLALYSSSFGLVQGGQFWTVRSWYNDIKPITTHYNGGTASVYNSGNWSGAFTSNYVLTWDSERLLIRAECLFYARDSDLTCYNGLFLDGVQQAYDAQTSHQNWTMTARPIAFSSGVGEGTHLVELRHQTTGFHMDVTGLSIQTQVI